MTPEEIKKTLYKLPVSASFIKASKRGLTYKAKICHTGMVFDSPITETTITFEIPFSDIGDATFESTMPAKLLIRYLIIPETNP